MSGDNGLGTDSKVRRLPLSSAGSPLDHPGCRGHLMDNYEL